MGKGDKYFLFNKEEDFKRCFLGNMVFGEGVLRTAGENGNSGSVIISRILDSQKEDMQWHRIFIEIKSEGQITFKLSIFSLNDMSNVKERLDKALMDPDMDLAERKRILIPYLKKEVYDTDDVLLHDISGRYLLFMIETSVKENQRFEIRRVKICFPKTSWISCLPEVYQNADKNQFLERFLAIFQTLHEELNLEIERIPALIDVESADVEFLSSLSKWLGLYNSHMWKENRLRELLKNFPEYYRKRGSKEAVKKFVRLYTDSESVFVVENFEIRGYPNKEELERLYGNDPYSFCVIVYKEQSSLREQYQSLVKIIEESAPANMTPKLIVLKPYIFLSRYSYMEVNSVLGEYRDLSLDGFCEIEYSVLEGRR